MKKMIWAVLPFLLLTGCGSDDANSTGAGNSLEEVKVDITTAEQAEPAEEIVLSATVTQGEEPVEDADEVVFEVWQSGHRDQGEMIEAEHTADGIYEADTVLGSEGLYFIQAHTTARRMHTMPKQEITIGDPDPESIVPDDSDDANSMDKMDDHSGH